MLMIIYIDKPRVIFKKRLVKEKLYLNEYYKVYSISECAWYLVRSSNRCGAAANISSCPPRKLLLLNTAKTQHLRIS